MQDCFELVLHLEADYHLSEGESLARAAYIMTLQAKGINEIYQGNYLRARSNTCFRCEMIGHFVRECTAGTVNTADDAPLFPIVG